MDSRTFVMHAASLTSLFAFLAICEGVVAAFIWGVWTSARRESVSPSRRTLPVAIGTILWLSAILLVVGSGWLEGDQRRLLLFGAAINAVSLGIGLSPVGRNWDIVSGVLALVAAPFCRRSRVVAWIANGVGLALLANVMRVAVMSSPVSFGWPVLPKLQLIFHVPYALIVPVCVGGALIGHIALTRALLRRGA